MSRAPARSRSVVWILPCPPSLFVYVCLNPPGCRPHLFLLQTPPHRSSSGKKQSSSTPAARSPAKAHSSLTFAPQRETIVRNLKQALGDEDGALARKIEQELFLMTGHRMDSAYKDQIRQILLNLRLAGNEEFKSRVLDGSVTPYELVRLEPHLMTAQSKIAEREAIKKEILFDKIKPPSEQEETKKEQEHHPGSASTTAEATVIRNVAIPDVIDQLRPRAQSRGVEQKLDTSSAVSDGAPDGDTDDEMEGLAGDAETPPLSPSVTPRTAPLPRFQSFGDGVEDSSLSPSRQKPKATDQQKSSSREAPTTPKSDLPPVPETFQDVWIGQMQSNDGKCSFPAYLHQISGTKIRSMTLPNPLRVMGVSRPSSPD